MKQDIENFVHRCETCQKYKTTGIKKYGKLPLKDNVSQESLDEVHMDLVGPWAIDIEQQAKRTMTVNVSELTILDVGASLVEIILCRTKKSEHVANLFDNEWLCRYLWPKRVI